MLQTSCMSLYEDLTYRSFFVWPLISYDSIGEIGTSLDQKYIRRKKKGNQPRRSRLGVDTHDMSAKFHCLLKSSWTLRHLCRKHVYFA